MASKNIELTAEQRKLADQWEKEQQAKQDKQTKQSEMMEKMRDEAASVGKFLLSLDVKSRRTQLIVEQQTEAGPKKKAVNCNYILGTNLHVAVLTHKEEIMKLVPTMNSHKSFNNLTGIMDSCQLISGLISFNVMNRVIPNRMQYSDPQDPGAKKPKSCEILPMEHMRVDPTGFYIFQLQEEGAKTRTTLWLVLGVALAFFFLLFRVWPEWLKMGVWYLSWYTLVFLISMAIIRAIVWFAIFHIGIDFWIFPNYFIDSDNILDSFWPLLSLNMRDDMFDARMFLLRIASCCAIFYGAQEFFKDPENLESMMGGGGELWDEMYDWGQNKFMGTVDPNQQIDVKKSARQIYAEAFMDDENPMFRTSTQFNDFADDDAMKAAFEAEKNMTAEEKAKQAFEDSLDAEEDEESIELDDSKKGGEAAEDVDDLLDRLMGDDDDEEEEQEETKEDTDAADARAKSAKLEELKQAAEAEAEAEKKEEAEAKAKAIAELKAARKLQQEEEAESKRLREAEATAKAEAEAAAKAEAEEKAKVKADVIALENSRLAKIAAAKAEKEHEEKEKAEALAAKAKSEAEAKAQADADEKAKAEADAAAKAKSEAAAKAKAEAIAKAKAEVDAAAKAKVEAEAKAKAEAVAEAQANAEAWEKARAEQHAGGDEDAKARAEAAAAEPEQAEDFAE